jgi:hypothetical protein
MVILVMTNYIKNLQRHGIFNYSSDMICATFLRALFVMSIGEYAFSNRRKHKCEMAISEFKLPLFEQFGIWLNFLARTSSVIFKKHWEGQDLATT